MWLDDLTQRRYEKQTQHQVLDVSQVENMQEKIAAIKQQEQAQEKKKREWGVNTATLVKEIGSTSFDTTKIMTTLSSHYPHLPDISSEEIDQWPAWKKETLEDILTITADPAAQASVFGLRRNSSLDTTEAMLDAHENVLARQTQDVADALLWNDWFLWSVGTLSRLYCEWMQSACNYLAEMW